MLSTNLYICLKGNEYVPKRINFKTLSKHIYCLITFTIGIKQHVGAKKSQILF